jgi:hypothetical protein
LYGLLGAFRLPDLGRRLRLGCGGAGAPVFGRGSGRFFAGLGFDLLAGAAGGGGQDETGGVVGAAALDWGRTLV